MNLDKLKEYMGIANHEWIIGISETHFTGTLLECYNLPGYEMELVVKRGSVC